MIFYSLISKSNWENVELSLLKHYPQTRLSIEKYKNAFHEIKKMIPVPTELRLAVYKCDDDIGFNVCGLDGTLYCEIQGFDADLYSEDANKECGFGIGFVKWEEWLGMEIDINTLKTMSEDDFVAHCFWEMTFYSESVNQQSCKQ